MKKYILSLVAALCFCTTPIFANTENDGAAAEEIVFVTVSTEDDGATIVLTDNEGNEARLDSASYKEQLDRNLSNEKIFKNTKIDNADGAGIGVTLMAMCIVLLALIVLSCLFMFFGKIFAKNQSKKKSEAHGETAPIEEDDHDSGEVIAAIALALDEHFNAKHDLEDTVLTIRRMKRAYSPWNSKIYNMREVPTLRKR